MLEVKIFKDEKLLRHVIGKSVSVTAVIPIENGAKVKGFCVNDGVDKDVLLKAMASTCVDHIVELSESEDDGCMKVGKFIDDVIRYSIDLLEKKYRE